MASIPEAWASRGPYGALAACLLSALLLLPPAATARAEAPVTVLSLADGQVNLTVRDVPRGAALAALADAAGFSLIDAEGLSEPLDLSLARQPVEQAVLQLLAGHSAVLVYDPLEDGGSRLSAVRVLTAEGQGRTRAAPQQATTVPQAGTQQEALYQLAGRRDKAALEALVGTAANDPDPQRRRTAVAALSAWRLPQARGAIASALDDEDPNVRRRAVEALIRTWGAAAVKPLANALAENDDPAVRRRAAAALGRMAGETAYLALTSGQADADPTVRAAVAAALARQE